MTPTDLATALRAHAQGLHCLEAGAELLIAQSWLQRADFSGKFINISPVDGQAPAIDWAAAINALDAGELPCSGGEQRTKTASPESTNATSNGSCEPCCAHRGDANRVS